MTQTVEPIDERRWEHIVNRKRDERFRFGVTTTHIYCRSGCPARTPRREHVVAFDDAGAARRAGFRACKRCEPDTQPDAARARAIARACALLDAAEPPPLDAIAQHVGLSRFHFQRVFRQIVGVTPGEYRRARRAERLRAELGAGSRVTDALLDAGFGSPSRAYDDDALGMTPSTFRAGGKGQRIAYASAPCALGTVLVATTPRGVCAIELGDDARALEAELRKRFPHAELHAAPADVRDALAAVVRAVDRPDHELTLPLDVRGTAFQRRVWRALRALRSGETTTYAALAAALGEPHNARAVAAACAANPVALAVPCHRVVGSDRALRGYRWGLERKRALLAREANVR
ncbi:MAG TPA: bifunctional DNA-binding transcriptional regulator/O6-methylguanine-DNA methyltransferase Ada [Candidatus Sulfotelmatobacter sp.]|nr:bifunctional DNA-binding transcriptional regulator/O6-methylguanine-DNA methyltransferase Ada [Candidatus Sulfotelmatobacter sp.]